MGIGCIYHRLLKWSLLCIFFSLKHVTNLERQIISPLSWRAVGEAWKLYIVELVSSVHMWNHIIAPHASIDVRSDRVPAIVISQAQKSKICSTCPGTSLEFHRILIKPGKFDQCLLLTSHPFGHPTTTGCDMWSQPPLMAFLRMDALV